MSGEALSWAHILAMLGVVCLCVATFLTFSFKGLETRLEAVSARVNDHTVLITINSNKLTRLETLVIANSTKLNKLVEDNKHCHDLKELALPP